MSNGKTLLVGTCISAINHLKEPHSHSVRPLSTQDSRGSCWHLS